MSLPPMPAETILTVLSENPGRLAAGTAGATAERLRERTGAEPWSATDVLAHIRSCCDVWGGYIGRMLREDGPRIQAVSPRRWIDRTPYRELDFGDSLRDWAAQRTELLGVLEPLAEADWQRGATVTGERRVRVPSVQSYAEILARHERQHVDQIPQILRANGGGR
jgi:hypothetical protein